MDVTWVMPREPDRSENQITLFFFFKSSFSLCQKKQECNSSPTLQQAVLDFICFYSSGQFLCKSFHT